MPPICQAKEISAFPHWAVFPYSFRSIADADVGKWLENPDLRSVDVSSLNFNENPATNQVFLGRTENFKKIYSTSLAAFFAKQSNALQNARYSPGEDQVSGRVKSRYTVPGSPSDLNTGNRIEGATGWCRPLRPLFHFLCSNLKANPVYKLFITCSVLPNWEPESCCKIR